MRSWDFPLLESYDVTGSESRVKAVSPWFSWCVFTTDEKKPSRSTPPACQFAVSGSAFAELLRSFALLLSCSPLWVVLRWFGPTLTRSTCLCGLHLTHGASIRHHLCRQMRLHPLKHDIFCLERTLEIKKTSFFGRVVICFPHTGLSTKFHKVSEKDPESEGVSLYTHFPN